jgi:hypothetical protein
MGQTCQEERFVCVMSPRNLFRLRYSWLGGNRYPASHYEKRAGKRQTKAA